MEPTARNLLPPNQRKGLHRLPSVNIGMPSYGWIVDCCDLVLRAVMLTAPMRYTDVGSFPPRALPEDFTDNRVGRMA